MEVYKTIETLNKKTAIALGFFDGLHLAHQQVIQAVVSTENKALVPTVLTFSIANSAPQNKRDMKTILTDAQKFIELEKMGVAQVLIPEFSEIDGMEATVFFEELLVKKFQAAEISCGFDYTFGNKASGNVQLLQELCNKHNIVLTVLPKIEEDGIVVSSSKIREYLLTGDMASANALLGYQYYTYGEVLHGKRIGRTIGFPTINQSLLETQVIPRYGVYKTTTYVDEKAYKSVTSVGVKPTIAGERLPLVETYIVGYEGDAYGKIVKVCYHEFLRGEQKFSSVEELKQAILKDVEWAIR